MAARSTPSLALENLESRLNLSSMTGLFPTAPAAAGSATAQDVGTTPSRVYRYDALSVTQAGATQATYGALWTNTGNANAQRFFDLFKGNFATISPYKKPPAPTVTVAVATPASSGASTVTGTSTTLSVLGTDSTGESNLSYAWSLTGAPSGGTPTFSVNGNNAAKNTAVTFNKAGSYTFLVTISDGNKAVTSSVSLVVDQSLTTISVTPGSFSLAPNQTRTLSAMGYDQFGASLSVQPGFTWTKASGVGTVDSGGHYSSGSTAGAATITASSGGVTGTATASVSNGAPTVATAASAASYSINGISTTLNALGADDGGESNLTYSWSATAAPGGSNATFSSNGGNASKSTVVTFNKAGSYSFMVTISDGTSSVTSSLTLTVNQALTGITITPGSTSVNTNGTQQFSATAYDQFSQALTVQPGFTWTSNGVGSINSSGLFSAGGTGGSGTVRAASGAVSATASVTVSAIGTPVAISQITEGNLTRLVITGTSGNDSIFVSQSGNTLTITGNGNVSNVTGTFDEIAIYGGDGNDTITVQSSVNIVSLLYGGAGSNTISAGGSAQSYIVTIGAGVSNVTGNGINTAFWVNGGDTVHASAAETAGGNVHVVSGFYGGVTTLLAGQNLADPTDSGTTANYSNRSLFGTMPAMTDVNQGQVGDCYFLASIQSFANNLPARLEEMAVDLGDGTYAVQFKRNGATTYVRVDGDLPMASWGGLSYNSPSGGGPIWASIMEKAYAFFRTGAGTYASLNSGWTGSVFSDLGVANTSFSTGASGLYNTIATALAASKAVAIISVPGAGSPIIGSHAYSIVAASTDGNGVQWFTVRNPWGVDGAGNDGVNDGLVTITLAQLKANFSMGSISV